MKFYESFKRAKEVMLRTEDFFKNVKKEKGIRHAFVYLLILTFTFMIFTTYYYLDKFSVLAETIGNITGLPADASMFQLDFKTFIVFYVFMAVFTVLFAFVRYWVVHMFIKIFKRDARYDETYRALSYSTAPGYAGAPFLMVWLLLLPFLREWWVWLIFVPCFAVYLGFEIYSLYVRSKAVSVVHKMSMLLSFTCIYILGTIGFLILVVLLEILILVPVLFFMFSAS